MSASTVGDYEGDEYQLAACPMPYCDATLFLRTMAHQDIYLSFGPSDLTSADDMPSWEVRCLNGHVLLLPPDDGGEWHKFGLCTSHDIEAGDEHDLDCGAGDFARLQRIVAMGKGAPA